VVKLKDSFSFELQKNYGVKSAGTCRNIGLENSNGKWLLFADSDDFFLDSMMSQVCKYFDEDLEIIFFPPTSIYDNASEIGLRHLPYERLVLNYLRDQDKYFTDLVYDFVPPWSKMYSRGFLYKHKCKFDELLAANDVYFSITAGHKATKICATNIPIYCITMTRGSLVNKVCLPILEARVKTVIKSNAFFKSINQCHRMRSVMYFLYESRLLGLRASLSLLWFIIKMGGNPFWGWKKWLYTYKRRYQTKDANEKYRVVDR
jgi:glycosyltransferase involved in cell wall biosynthesis